VAKSQYCSPRRTLRAPPRRTCCERRQSEHRTRTMSSGCWSRRSRARRSSCQVTVNFFGADGALIGEPKTVQSKPEESKSVAASDPPRLVRAAVSVDHVTDSPQLCALKASLEVFDARTGTTFVSIPGEFINGNAECAPTAPAPTVAATSTPSRANAAPLATLSTSGMTKRPRVGTPACKAPGL
jgi:hypothetical protein